MPTVSRSSSRSHVSSTSRSDKKPTAKKPEPRKETKARGWSAKNNDEAIRRWRARNDVPYSSRLVGPGFGGPRS